MMRERWILFSGAMVRAILDGRKTQTRRVIKPQPDNTLGSFASLLGQRCPYGQPGDRLWVREMWRLVRVNAGTNCEFLDVQYRAGFAVRSRENCVDMAANQLTSAKWEMGERCAFDRWRPSIHMPRWASRITLEVTGIRVDRVQDVSEADARAEGVTATYGTARQDDEKRWRADHRAEFAKLWDAINAKRGYGWDTNPWVWVVEFRRVDDA